MWGFKISGNVLNSFYESVGDGVCINEVIYNDNGHPVDYRIIDANPAYESITGFKREEIAGQRASIVYNTENPPHLNIYARVAETGEKANFETYTPQLRKHFNVSVISPEKGKFITILTDITSHSEIDDELETVYENVPVVLMMVDSDRRILKLNKNAELFAGKSSEELVGSRGGEALGCLHSLDDPEGCGFGPHCKDCIVKNTVLDTFETGNNHYNIEASLPFIVDGREKNLTFLLSTSLINTENKSKVLVSIQDITERKETEKELKESEERFRTLTEKAADAIIAHDFDGNIIYANETASKNLGYPRDEILSLNVTDIDPYVDIDVFRDKYWNKTSSDTSYFIGTYHKRKDGTIFPVEVRLTRINLNEKPVILAYIRDITIRKQAEERLKEQKEQVIETERIRQLELHHRIKNNLQVISSLISLQSEKFTDNNVKDAFIDTRNRVISMSLVHNKLYQAKGLENVNTKDYIGDLVDHLNELYNIPNIDINIDVEDIYLGIDTIIPLGMLINEILSNSLKYAFSESETGKIEIKLYQNNNKNYTLIVADNGKGMPENVDVKDADTLGLQLIKNLIDQIGGDFEVNKEKGTKFIIEFSG